MIEFGVERLVLTEERIHHGREICVIVMPLNAKKPQMSDKVGDIHGWLGHGGIIEIEDGQSVLGDQDLVVIHVSMYWSMPPAEMTMVECVNTA